MGDKLTPEEIELVYVNNDHYLTVEKMPDDTPEGSNHWKCYIPSVITRKLGLVPKDRERYILTIGAKAQDVSPDCIDGKVFNQAHPSELDTCLTCEGTGIYSETGRGSDGFEKCPICGGEGRLLQYADGQGEEVGCDYCEGTGRKKTEGEIRAEGRNRLLGRSRRSCGSLGTVRNRRT
ncbi:hypothetical protein LCGC14_0787870 [marine sediment metagenome]|uniref:CR-type domain-containing protein n=1 Tax=marine sediment metagenome TaxID=412755 RepID=A0A0F9T0N4_9ZZZZ